MKKLFVLTTILAGAMLYAGGFRVSLQGVKQLAMAHTSAHAEDASVAFFNPAGISFIPAKLSVAAGGFGTFSKITFQNRSTMQSYETDNPVGTPMYAAVAYKIIDDVSVGFSFTTPFGSTIDWGEDWEGKELVQKMELRAMYFQPMVSVKLAPWVAFGASYIYATGKVDWDKAVTQFDGTLNLSDDKATGSGFGIGFYFQPSDKLDVSVAYRSPVDMKAKNGVATFNVSPSLFPLIGVDANGQDKFKATLPLVDEYTIGITYKITPKWLMSADFNYTGWSEYYNLLLDFENAPIGNIDEDETMLLTPKNFHNTRTIRLGTEYKFSDMFAGRLGWYYDESPYEDKDFIAETPSFDANVITAGIGLNFGSFGVDIAAAKSFPKSRNVDNMYYDFYGQAKAQTLYLGLGLRYNLIK
ncbi:MAG: outer membrane protein transport protein [Flavobacteriaceae bacterium]|nr:outer membrane protein transport protein [Flavobacteriaceae bacterium]